jgi:hypothetical protein
MTSYWSIWPQSHVDTSLFQEKNVISIYLNEKKFNEIINRPTATADKILSQSPTNSPQRNKQWEN